MAKHSLHKVKKTVRGKGGKTYQRSVMVKSADAGSKKTKRALKSEGSTTHGILGRHGGRILAATALTAAAAYMAHKHLGSGTASRSSAPAAHEHPHDAYMRINKIKPNMSHDYDAYMRDNKIKPHVMR